jgi:hypothetical protein
VNGKGFVTERKRKVLEMAAKDRFVSVKVFEANGDFIAGAYNKKYDVTFIQDSRMWDTLQITVSTPNVKYGTLSAVIGVDKKQAREMAHHLLMWAGIVDTKKVD